MIGPIVLALALLADQPVSDDEATQFANARSVKLTTPVYPRKALRKGIEGEVRTCFTVTANGKVRKPRIMYTSNRMFNRSTKRAALDSSFLPAIRDGKATDSQFCRTYYYTLDDFGR